jgi:hypothetical protein
VTLPLSKHILVSLLVMAALMGCRGQTTQDTPVVPIRNMYNQPRYDAQERSAFFQDGRTMRPQVDGTVSREDDPNLGVATGRADDNAEWVLEVPRQVVQRNGGGASFVARGQERYTIYCAPCHGDTGSAEGPVAQPRGAPELQRDGSAHLPRRAPPRHPGWPALRHHLPRHPQHACLRAEHPHG